MKLFVPEDLAHHTATASPALDVWNLRRGAAILETGVIFNPTA
jgi:hypothetical protein